MYEVPLLFNTIPFTLLFENELIPVKFASGIVWINRFNVLLSLVVADRPLPVASPLEFKPLPEVLLETKLVRVIFSTAFPLTTIDRLSPPVVEEFAQEPDPLPLTVSLLLE